MRVLIFVLSILVAVTGGVVVGYAKASSECFSTSFAGPKR